MSAAPATPTTTTASFKTGFQGTFPTFQTALKAYQKQTKEDLLTHPLTSQLQSCESTSAIRDILQVRVQEFDKSRSGDERLTKWLSPTVAVLDAHSAAVSEGVSLVGLSLELRRVSDICFVGLFTCNCDLRGHWCLPCGKYIIYFLGQIVLMSYIC